MGKMWKVIPAVVGVVKGAGVSVDYDSRAAAEKVASQVAGSKVVEVEVVKGRGGSGRRGK